MDSFQLLILDMSAVASRVSVKIKNRMADSVDPDEMAHYEPSHLDLHCLYRYLFWSARLKGLQMILATFSLSTLH